MERAWTCWLPALTHSALLLQGQATGGLLSASWVYFLMYSVTLISVEGK